MNILVFSWRDPKHPLAGGAEQVMHEHMKRWVRAGHKVTLFSSKMKNLPAKELIDNISIIRQGYQYLGVQIRGVIYYLKNRKKYDLVVDQFHGLPFFTPLYVRKPILAVIQETARKVWFLNPLPWPLNLIIGVVGYIGEPLMFLSYRKIKFMTGSESAKQDVIKMGIPQENMIVVPHGVVVVKPSYKIAKEKIPTLTFLGVLSKDKGIEDALRCFALLNEQGKFNFWVIGRPETRSYEQRLQEMVGRLGLVSSIKFWGFVSQEEKFRLLAKSHLLVNPSVREGWGLVNIEANAMGTPVVAYYSAGLIDSVKDGVSGILCKTNNPEALAENVQSLLNNQKQQKLVQEGALRWSNNFSWKKSSEISLQLVENIVSTNS